MTVSLRVGIGWVEESVREQVCNLFPKIGTSLEHPFQ